MSELLGILAINALTATLLAVVVAVASGRVRCPGVVHVLWVVVLAELVIPPVFEVGILPQPLQPAVAPLAVEEPPAVSRGSDLPVTATTTFESVPSSTGPSGALPPRAPARVDLASGIVLLWGLGAAVVLLLALVRTRRFRRLVADAAVPSRGLERRVADLAIRLGRCRGPRLRLVEARISPMVWPRLGRPELLFPAGLLDRLDADERDALLTHELAHLVRRDHWVRLLELAAGALFWWHPLVGWVRSRLHRAEEQCCDQVVVRSCPTASRAYARALVKTVEFLAAPGPRVPALASGVGEVRNLEERLTMILSARPSKTLSRVQRTVLAVAAAGVLLVFPTWADPAWGEAPSDPERELALAREQERFQHAMLDLERQALELEAALQQVRSRQIALRKEWHDIAGVAEGDRLRKEAAEVEAAGAYERALAMRERAQLADRQRVLESRMLRAERERLEGVAQTEIELRRLQLEIERLEASGRGQEAAELRRQARELESELALRHRDDRMHRLRLEQEMTRARLDEVRAEIEWLRGAGRHAEADELEHRRKRMVEEIEHDRRLRARDEDLSRLHAELERLVDQADDLEAQGQTGALRELQERIEEIQLLIEREHAARHQPEMLD